jgi:hypothetical protein
MLAMSPPKAWIVQRRQVLRQRLDQVGLAGAASEVASSTWIGEALFSTFRPEARVPVTITTPEMVGPPSAAAALCRGRACRHGRLVFLARGRGRGAA